ncbi:MAG: TlpA family protein disulfide reductase [Terriglobia bacterium]
MVGASQRAGRLLAVVAVLVAMGLAGCREGPKSAASGQTLRPLPAFELEALDGSRFSSDALAGQVALVDLWATWCKPCLAEIPHWNEFYERYADQGFTVLGITIQSGWASDIKSDVEKFEFEINYPLVVGNEEVEEGFGGVLGFPTTFLITRGGKIYKKYTGLYPDKQAEIEADIKKLLLEKP